MNLILKFTNDQSSNVLRIDFKKMDKILAQAVLGIKLTVPDPEIELGKIIKGEPYLESADYSRNLQNYWYNFDKQMA